MPVKRYTSRHVARMDAPDLRPPNLRALGILPFTLQDRQSLSAWLAEAGWPRGRMDVATLEGYLVALLVWPVGIAPGAWLPPIWGGKGWKVPAKMASPGLFDKFIGFVVGFLQHLDRELSTLPRYDFGVRGQDPAGVSWAQGFLKALQQSSRGLQGRSDAVRAAVSRIAQYASSPAHAMGTESVVAAELTTAVLTLTAARSSRGPLGALEPCDPGRLAPHTGIPNSSKTSMGESDRCSRGNE